MQELPHFQYHPDPLATGAIEPSGAVCECCGEARGFVYTGAVFCVDEIEPVCPWCIADGSAHARYDATFSDAVPLVAAGVPSAVVDEVTQRTPGYESWQQDSWISCCGDACEVHGDAPQAEIRGLDDEGVARLAASTGFLVPDLREIVAHYEPGGSPAFYKFVCRHCGQIHYGGDCD